MTDYYLPPDIGPGEVRWSAPDSTSVFIADTINAVRSSEIVGGSMLMPTFKWPLLKNESATARVRSRAISVLKKLRGQANRIWLYVPGYVQQGSFAATEILSDPTFSGGVSGLTAGSAFSLSAIERLIRATRSQNTNADAGFFRNTSALTVTANVPYAVRIMVQAGRRSPSTLRLDVGSTAFGVEYGSLGSLSPGLLTSVFVPSSTSAYIALTDVANTAALAGDTFDFPYWSVARCFLADNGPNAMTRSDELDNAAWTKDRTTATANAAVAADGSTTMDAVVENNETNSHAIRPASHPTRTSQAEDLIVFGEFKRGAGTRDIQLRVGSDASNHGSAHFDLSTGAISNITNTGTATNTRAFSVNLGNGIWRCYVITRAAASTSLYSQYNLLASGSNNYAGDSTSSVYARRLGCARSSFPVVPAQTVASAAASGTAQAGVNLQVKGLPVSTTGLLEAGDIVQIGRELHWIRARLDSDAAGCGLLQMTNPIRTAPSDSGAIIVNNPLGKFLQAKNVLEWDDQPGGISELEVEFLEATAG